MLGLLPAMGAASPGPPLVCPAGGPIGSVDLRVTSPQTQDDPLPLRTINRLEEGDIIHYRPLLRSGEQRKGEVALVLVPARHNPGDDELLILDPKDANKPQEWTVPTRTAVASYVYGPSGLNRKKVKNFLTRDSDLIGQLADYAEKTAQTEALIAALASPTSSSANVQSALQGFSSQYGLSVQIDKSAPSDQQALALFRTLNPAIANYDPISPQRNQQLGQTAVLATSVAALFFGNPVGLAAGGTAMLMQLRSIAFPGAEFRSSFAQTINRDGLGLCGQRTPAPPHTRVAYLWATRIPNVGSPAISVEKANSLPMGIKSPLPMSANDQDWKVIDRARHWTLRSEDGKSIPIKVQKLGQSKMLELDLDRDLKPGRYSLAANWDWKSFPVKGNIDVLPLSDFGKARLAASSQDLLVSKTGKIPVILEGGNFEFVTKVEFQKEDDEFSAPVGVPFVLRQGLRQGPQDRMDVQLNTIDLDPGSYTLLLTQVDGKAQPVKMKILPAPPQFDNLPIVVNQGSSSVTFQLTGQRLSQVTRIEVPNGTIDLGKKPAEGKRDLTLRLSDSIAAGTSLTAKAFIKDRNQPLTLSDAVRIVGPRPRITEAAVSPPATQDVQLNQGELPGGSYISAMLRLANLQSNSSIKLACKQPGGSIVVLHLGERLGPVSLQQLAPDQVFLSLDTGVWLNGCQLQATVANGDEGESESYSLGKIVRVPKLDQLEYLPEEGGGQARTKAVLSGQNLETIEKVAWIPSAPEAVLGIPMVTPGGDGTKQTLQLTLARPADPHALLHIWLRGEEAPRSTRVHP